MTLKKNLYYIFIKLWLSSIEQVKQKGDHNTETYLTFSFATEDILDADISDTCHTWSFQHILKSSMMCKTDSQLQM